MCQRRSYHAVLVPNARLRPQVIAIGPAEADEAREPVGATPCKQPNKPPPSEPAPGTPCPGSARIRWAQLLARIYEVLPLLCPSCGGEMRILAFLTEPVTVRTILVHLELPHRPPPLTPARGPPRRDLLLDQTPDHATRGALDVTAPEPVPELELDQSLPEEFDD